MREGTFRVIALLLFVSLIYYGYGIAVGQFGAETDLNQIVANSAAGTTAEPDLAPDEVADTPIIESDPVLRPLPADGSDFFIDYRLDRERARSYQSELLSGLVDNPRIDDVSRREATQQLLQISRAVEKEMEIESLIRAKGFSDSLIMFNPDSVVVIVKATVLGDVEVARILDIVTRSTGVKTDKVIVLPKN